MTPAISLAQVTELASGSWVNDPFTAVVDRIEQKEVKKTKRPFWVLKLSDTTGSATAEASMFTAPKFNEGDQIEVSGQGVKFEENQYGRKISWGDKATVVVVRHAPQKDDRHPSETPPPRAPGSSNPLPPSEPAATKTMEEQRGEEHAKFHLKMKKLALTRMHCFEYANKIVSKAIESGFVHFRDGDETSRPEMVGTVSSGLFIECCKRGWDDKVVPMGDAWKMVKPNPPAPAAPMPVQPPPQRAAQPPPSNQPPARTVEEHSRNTQAFDHRGSHVDEDVPF